ncbi:phenylacetate--CoA ligase family protein [Pseudonocardia sp. TRM90224]|uniref:phenylacetate--CoA ligase family protein n=1 Tax=Pseudonocardia sp. TRM90224 TaxID=2812678 RepID=UPI001E5ED082|nr:phenylacetate--CoA ligase family protein [Pseudonocardia sp. TRM90224]
MDADRPARYVEALQTFVGAPDPVEQNWPLALFRQVSAEVPAYRALLAERGISPDAVRTMADFRALPIIDKASYHSRYPLPLLCRHGRLDANDMIAVSSGSSGTPTIWPRSPVDELAVTPRFEQVFRDGFAAHERSTLAVVCFPLGTWVGGLFTLACLRQLTIKGYPITVVAPGNNKAEILRVLPELAPHFDQTVLLGYPPFVKDVVDTGVAAGIDWLAYAVKLVLAGEVFSEEWRNLMAERTGMRDPVRDVASLYGTADAGVLATETPLSVSIRRFLAGRPDLARELFGDSRLPTLAQYDPASRFFETHEGTLLFTADNGIPLVRYHIADEGGLVAHAAMLDFCAANGFDPEDAGPDLPFVFVFGRSLFTVSFFGANVYPENVTVGLEQPEVSSWVTGKFVLETVEDADRDRVLRVTVELAPGRTGDATVLAASVRDQLVRLNSEYAHYVPAERQLPEVRLLPAGDPEYFPVGVKHRYTRGG